MDFTPVENSYTFHTLERVKIEFSLADTQMHRYYTVGEQRCTSNSLVSYFLI